MHNLPSQRRSGSLYWHLCSRLRIPTVVSMKPSSLGIREAVVNLLQTLTQPLQPWHGSDGIKVKRIDTNCWQSPQSTLVVVTLNACISETSETFWGHLKAHWGFLFTFFTQSLHLRKSLIQEHFESTEDIVFNATPKIRNIITYMYTVDYSKAMSVDVVHY